MVNIWNSYLNLISKCLTIHSKVRSSQGNNVFKNVNKKKNHKNHHSLIVKLKFFDSTLNYIIETPTMANKLKNDFL